MTAPVTRVPRPPGRGLRATGAGLTHAGRVRRTNEDAILTDPGGALWAVADGLGGLGHGDVAADIVIDHLARLPHPAAPADLDAALDAANAAIRRRAARDGLGQIASTAVAALVAGDRAHLAWAGDSRAYRARDGGIERLTTDHSVVQELVDLYGLGEAEAARHPQAHVVTRAIGGAERVEVASREAPLAPGDRLLLCSDGLTRCLSDAEIAGRLAAPDPPDALCRALVAAALDRGAPDNVSVIVVRLEAGDP